MTLNATTAKEATDGSMLAPATIHSRTSRLGLLRPSLRLELPLLREFHDFLKVDPRLGLLFPPSPPRADLWSSGAGHPLVGTDPPANYRRVHQ